MAQASAEQLAAEPLPRSAGGLAEHAEVLRELLNAARAGRAHLANSLVRVRAAKRFQSEAALESDDCQNLVDSTNF